MGRTIVESDWRIIVEPRNLGDLGQIHVPEQWLCKGHKDRSEKYRERCEEIMRDIKRHVADVGSVRVEAEREVACEYCGAAWTEDGDVYNGGCCEEDEENSGYQINKEA